MSALGGVVLRYGLSRSRFIYHNNPRVVSSTLQFSMLSRKTSTIARRMMCLNAPHQMNMKKREEEEDMKKEDNIDGSNGNGGDMKDGKMKGRDRWRNSVKERVGDMKGKVEETRESVIEGMKEHIEETRELAKERGEQVQKGVRALWNRYGLIFIGTYSTVYIAALSGMYISISRGFDVKAFIQSVGLSKWVDISHMDDTSSNMIMAFLATKLTSPISFMMAWGATTMTGPIRAPLVVMITPSVARFLWNIFPSLKPNIEQHSKNTINNNINKTSHK